MVLLAINRIRYNQDNYDAVIQYDPDIEMFRGEFVGLNGGADFYAPDVVGLRKEGAISLKVFLEMCAEDDVSPIAKDSKPVNEERPRGQAA